MTSTTRRNLNIAAILLVTFILPGCAHRAAENSKVAVERPVVKKIALVPVMEPSRFAIENRGGPLNFLGPAGYAIKKGIEEGRSNLLTAALRSHSLKVGDEMTLALKEELAGKGYEVTVVSKVKRDEDEPDEFDYDSIETDADAIVSARYKDAGLLSGFSTMSYWPRLNVEVEMVSRIDEEELYSESINYGADGRKPDNDSIPSDPKYVFGDYEEAMARQLEIVESMHIGVRALAAQAAHQIRESDK